MLEDSFKLEHREGNLFVVITIDGESYEMDGTEYFEKEKVLEEWINYRIKHPKKSEAQLVWEAIKEGKLKP